MNGCDDENDPGVPWTLADFGWAAVLIAAVVGAVALTMGVVL